ncbi:hypothetical protein SAMN04488066_102268 [Halorubrum aquaticum]|uniref:TFIIB-type zinc ribbon-containing protein n=1 Tax=Halorubrum aquaticum TaxID=387340 RepID=A0A1I2ZP38_9EURY|nr:hypothetical protein [Halorubrum aquaticum]SFH38851.1 hypothetical protein SAMN04488066_102268 [Halorubrum aquaticum]
MKVRGERECRDCGSRWSYYETGSVECPDCGSLKSVGTADRAVHTDAPVSLELSPHRTRFGEARGTLPTEGVDDLKRDLREYVRRRGFVRGGELRPLDSTYLAARELLEAVDVYDRLRDPTDADREYLLALLAGADEGDRPAAAAVPEAMREARGTAAVRAVDEYREDLATFLEELAREGSERDRGSERDEGSVTVSDADGDPAERVAPARDVLERLRDRAKRVGALNGDVGPESADALVDAANALGDYVRSGETASLDGARDRIDEIEP